MKCAFDVYAALMITFSNRHVLHPTSNSHENVTNLNTLRELRWTWRDRGFGLDMTLSFDLVEKKAMINSTSTYRNVTSSLAFITYYKQVLDFAVALEVYAQDFDLEKV